MILVDTSIWIDHFRKPDEELTQLLDLRNVLIHPLVIGEISVGNVPRYELSITRLRQIPRASRARDDDVLDLVRTEKLYGTGIGYVDAHLLASARLTPSGRLWTRDKRLHREAARLGVAASI